ncbi:MAG: A24 family peptidase [Nocardioides sp.]|uniref:prepilin peptidase n=1 Tax=Nocardioides sp. TaxID=35761 RepID=UPI0039E459A2
MASGFVALICAVIGGLGGLLVPLLIGRLPEPDPGRENLDDIKVLAHDDADEPAKELYADIAARSGLGWQSALIGAAVGGLVGWSQGASWALVLLVPAVPLLTALSVIDLRTRLLPVRLIWPTYAVVVAGILIAAVATGDGAAVMRAAISALVCFVLYFVLWFIYPRGMGFGDVRLSGVLGLMLGYLGIGALVVGIYAGFLVFGLPGLVVAIARWDRKLLKVAYPYGPAMIVGALVGVLWGQPIWTALVSR